MKGLSLNVDWGEAVPGVVLGDPVGLRQSLGLLVENAIRSTEIGNIHVRIRFAGMENRIARIRFEVEDTGMGFNTETAERAFDYGSFLALTSVRQLARAMGGDAGVRSCPGVGSLFHFDVELKCLDTQVEITGWQRSVFIVANEPKVAAQWSTCFRRAGALICGTVARADAIPVKMLGSSTLLVAAAGMNLPEVPVPVIRIAPLARNVVGYLSNPLRMSEVRRVIHLPARCR
jgi:hypothetical protein